MEEEKWALISLKGTDWHKYESVGINITIERETETETDRDRQRQRETNWTDLDTNRIR